MLTRSMRIGCTLVLVLYAWSSAGALVSREGAYEVDASGQVLRASDTSLFEGLSQSKQQQRRQSLQDADPPGSTTSEDQCGLYLAPSTIGGAGLGIFSTIERSAGDYVGFNELVIPMIEVPFYNGEKDELFNPFIHYYWKGSEKGLHGIVAERRGSEVQGFVPGLDAATNCNLALINVGMSGATYDNHHFHRNRDPMAGAMTPYHTTPSQILRDIPAGGELFKFYGDRWFVAREDNFGVIPLSEDYPAAQVVVDKFDKLRNDHFSNNPELMGELWSLVKDTIGTEMWESRTMKAVPKTVEDAQQAAQHDITSLYQPQTIRSKEFLRQHGRCIDSIRPGPSTLENGQGGSGGFSTRRFFKGEILTGTPLLQIPYKELVTIYHMKLNHTNPDTGKETWTRKIDQIDGYQMMLNYCYGHPESTLLLCPYGSNIGYINHNKTRANVKIQWAPHGMIRQNHTWLQSKQVEDMEHEYNAGLAFDYVATKDIEEGEEIFLDYGDGFEEELTNYMSQWQPPENPEAYTPAEIFNKLVADVPLLTDAEQASRPYPENVETRCHPGLVHKEIRITDRSENGDYTWETRETGYPCRILERTEGEEMLYKVELKLPLDEIGRQHVKDKFNYVQKKNVRKSAIVFFNKPYTTDLFLQNTFRKEIGIPDDMFPEHWKNSRTAPK